MEQMRRTNRGNENFRLYRVAQISCMPFDPIAPFSLPGTIDCMYLASFCPQTAQTVSAHKTRSPGNQHADHVLKLG
jgi:hypothetical protein